MMVAISGRCATTLRPGFRSWLGYGPEVWHFSNRLSALLPWQRCTSVRRWPAPGRYRGSAAIAQFNWDVSRDLQLYWGVRSGAERIADPATGGRGMEIYLKASCAFRG
jgi:hypothetical protein